MTERNPPAAVLFDLDGTLIDSAPDLLAALDHVLAGYGLPPSNHGDLRHFASRGAGGILEAGLNGVKGLDIDDMKDVFLDFYADNLWRHTRPFAGMEAVLNRLAEHGCPLGIVTNKASRFADPVLRHAGWEELFACVITGDRVKRSKPHPEPVLAACKVLGVMPANTVFIGDDRRDIDAGRKAGTTTIVAGWGYLAPGEAVSQWGADLIASSPEELAILLGCRDQAAGVR